MRFAVEGNSYRCSHLGMHGCEAARGGGAQGACAREASDCGWQYALRIRP